MVDHIVDASERRGGVDIRVGVGRRRRWRAEDKGRIVAESYAPGAVVSEVARRHDITPQHLFVWRKAARAGRLTLPAEEAPMFVPVVTTIREVGAAEAATASVFLPMVCHSRNRLEQSPHTSARGPSPPSCRSILGTPKRRPAEAGRGVPYCIFKSDHFDGGGSVRRGLLPVSGGN
jgi:transposase